MKKMFLGLSIAALISNTAFAENYAQIGFHNIGFTLLQDGYYDDFGIHDAWGSASSESLINAHYGYYLAVQNNNPSYANNPAYNYVKAVGYDYSSEGSRYTSTPTANSDGGGLAISNLDGRGLTSYSKAANFGSLLGGEASSNAGGYLTFGLTAGTVVSLDFDILGDIVSDLYTPNDIAYINYGVHVSGTVYDEFGVPTTLESVYSLDEHIESTSFLNESFQINQTGNSITLQGGGMGAIYNAIFFVQSYSYNPPTNVVQIVQQVPEPSNIALLLIGLGFMGLRQLRKC